MVIIENHVHTPRWCRVIDRLASALRKTHPIAAAPSTFGIVNTTHPQNPKFRTNSTGRNIPMHQVHDDARNAAHAIGPTSLRRARTVSLVISVKRPSSEYDVTRESR